MCPSGCIWVPSGLLPIEYNPLVLQHLQSSLEPSIPTTFHFHLSNWQVSEDVLTYKRHVYILPDDSLWWSIVHHYHDHKTAGHLGYLKTHQLVPAEFWWPDLTQFVQQYIEWCTTCQQNKLNTHLTIPPLTPIQSLASCPFQQISCDLITNLPTSSGFDSLLVMVDHRLTKRIILCSIKKTVTIEGIATLFFYKVYLCFGLYDKIISDCGPQFTSAFAKELGKFLNYNLSLSTTYHPQSDRETEWVNQEIEIYLMIFCGSNPVSWADKFPHTEFTHNHCPPSHVLQKPSRFQTLQKRRQGMVGGQKSEMLYHQPEIHPQKRRTLYDHQSPIPNYLSTPFT